MFPELMFAETKLLTSCSASPTFSLQEMEAFASNVGRQLLDCILTADFPFHQSLDLTELFNHIS